MSSSDWSHLIAEFRGLWVAIDDDESTVLAAAATAKDAVARAAKKGVPAPLLFRVPDSLDAFVGYEIQL